MLEAAFHDPWCVDAQVTAANLGAHVAADARVIAFHYVLEGAVEVACGDDPPRRCGAGDALVLARNDLHRVGSDVSRPPVPAETLVRTVGESGVAEIRHGSGPRLLSRVVCGYLTADGRASLLLDSLPVLLVARLGHRTSTEWVASSLRFAARTAVSGRSDAQATLARIAELLFAEALREHFEASPSGGSGWLAALRDASLSRALRAMHAAPAADWNTPRLAELAALSRSAFAERFTRALGVPPMSYLMRLRLQLAARRLSESRDPVGRIATEVGYESESTFSRAFAREYGTSPGAHRRRTGPAALSATGE